MGLTSGGSLVAGQVFCDERLGGRTGGGYGLAGALWHGRRCAGRPAFHVTTTQLSWVTPFVVSTER